MQSYCKTVLFTLLTGLLVVMSSGLTMQAATPTPQVQLLKEQGTSKVLQAEVLIDAPVQTVWNTLVNYGNLKNIFPGYSRSEVLQAAGNVKTLDLKMKPSGLLPAFGYQVKVIEDKLAHTLHIERISGDFQSVSASYRMLPVGNGSQTRLSYVLTIDLGKSAPAFGAGYVLKSNTHKAMTALQAYCTREYHQQSPVRLANN